MKKTKDNPRLYYIASGMALAIYFLLKFLSGQSGNIYSDTELAFSVRYPDGVMIFAGKEQMGASGYIPACDPVTAKICFVYPAEAFPGTNFESGGVAIGLTAETDETSCLAAKGGETAYRERKKLGGFRFRVFDFGDAAMSHRSEGQNYRSFVNNRCFQLSSRINTSVFEVWEPGSVSRFTKTDEEWLAEKLKSVIFSLKME